MTKNLKEILIIILVLWIAGKYIFDKPEVIVKTKTEVKYDTVTIGAITEPEIKWKEKEVKDTTGLAELNATIDSLKEEMNKKVDSTGTLGTYYAEQDTTLHDSTGTEVGRLYVQVESRIPLDPLLKLHSSVAIINKSTETTNEVSNGLTFWQRFGISAQIGIGRGLITGQWDVYTGIGFHFRIN